MINREANLCALLVMATFPEVSRDRPEPLCCSQVSAHYVRPNISRNARDRTAAFFKVLSVLAEIFVFSYIGELCTPHSALHLERF